MLILQKEKRKVQTIGSSAVRDSIDFFIMILPAVVILFLFNYAPLYGLLIGFKKYNPNLGIFKSPWVGFENFKFFFTSSDAVRVTRNTLLYNGSFIIIDLVVAVTLAILFFNLRNRMALKVYNTIVILPKFLSAVLIAFIVYGILNPVSGVLNQVLASMGMEAVDWYSKPAAWPAILVIVHIWQTVGMNCILYYASLMSIDDSLFEAAILEGAGKWKMITNICIPHLSSIMCITSILAVGSIFAGDFGLFYQTPRDIGALYSTTDILPTYIFRGLKDGNMSISTAIGFFQSLVGMILVIVTNAIVTKIAPENSLF